MNYIEIDYMDNILMNALEELINKCDGYEPYYCDSHNDSFIQCALVDEDADSPVMYGFIGLLINNECGYVEVKDGVTCTKEEIEDFCMELPRYKRPKEIIFADIPRNATGKIEKPKLRKMYGADRLVEQENKG